MRIAVLASSLLSIVAAALIPLSALAASYTDVAGTSVSFSGINDQGGLWEQPVGAGDQLIFSPSSYAATCPGAGCPAGAVSVDDTLEFTVTANAGGSLGVILFSELATSSVTTDGGTVQVGIDALITQINITALGGTPVNNIQATGPNLVFLPGDTFNSNGVTAISGSAAVDLDAIIAAAFPLETRSATTVTFILNNPLTSFAIGGTNPLGSIQKNSFTVTVVPEPGTAILIGLGLAGLARRGRVSSSIRA